MRPLNDIQKNALLNALDPAKIGVLQGGHIDDHRPVYASDDFLDIIATDGVLQGYVEGRSPRELGIALLHFTESYESKVIG
jgi:hypothetical protein